MSIELPCIVNRITYQKDNFCVLACNLDPYSDKYKPEMEIMIAPAISAKYDNFTVVLTNLMSPIDNTLGGQYIFVGNIENDQKRGMQFKAEFYYMDTPSTDEGLRATLMSLPNVKEVRSQIILERWGIAEVINILDNNIEKLLEIPGINQKRLDPIKKEWDIKRYMCKFYHWLSSHNISANMADKLYKRWGNKSVETLQENPYKLCEIRGIGFITADRIAHQILDDVPFKARMMACIEYLIDDQTISESNLCVPYNLLKKLVIELIAKCNSNMNKETDTDLCLNTIIEVLKEDSKEKDKAKFELIKDIDESQSVVYIYNMDVWKKEKYISEKLLERSRYKKTISDEMKSIIDDTLNEVV